MKSVFKPFLFICMCVIQLTARSPLDLLQEAIKQPTSSDDFLEKHPLFNLDFLRRFDEVHDKLIQEYGFAEVNFHSSDNLKINGLWRQVENAKGTIITTVGFYPGRKEGMACLIPLLPEQYNILMVDARGHGKSEGPLFLSLWNYGLHEYKDIVGAINWVHQKTDDDIIIHGLCAGAFHASHAAIKMGQQELRERKVRGIVADSNWSSVAKAADPVIEAEICDKHAAASCARIILRDEKKPGESTSSWLNRIKQKQSFRILRGAIAYLFYSIKKLFLLDYYFHKNDPQTNLLDKADQIPIPVLYIHATDDALTPYDDAQEIAKKTPEHFLWGVQNSKHVCNHLKHKSQYREVLKHYFEYVKTYHQ